MPEKEGVNCITIGHNRSKEKMKDDARLSGRGTKRRGERKRHTE